MRALVRAGDAASEVVALGREDDEVRRPAEPAEQAGQRLDAGLPRQPLDADDAGPATKEPNE